MIGKKKVRHVLYISYDGLLEPLGASQVLPYISKLASDETIIFLLSYEKIADLADKRALLELKTHLEKSGIYWYQCRYTKYPAIVSTAFDMLIGITVGSWIIFQNKIDIVHARSYVAGVIALYLKKIFKVKFLFDMRGFWVDERLDSGLWRRESIVCLIARWFEKKLLISSDHIVSLSHRGVEELRKFPLLTSSMPLISVIPTCVDLERFCPKEKSNDLTFGYVGSVGLWYNFNAAARFFRLLSLRIPKIKILIANRNEHSVIKKCLAEANVSLGCVEIREVAPAAMPDFLNLIDVGVFFIDPTYSKLGSAPTKLAEFLACGIPCISNDGIGDMTHTLRKYRVGITVSGFSTNKLEEGLLEILRLLDDPNLHTRCREAAKREFSLESGVHSYKRIYERLST